MRSKLIEIYKTKAKLWDVVITSVIIISYMFLTDVEFASESPLITVFGVPAGCWFGYSVAEEIHKAMKKKS